MKKLINLMLLFVSVSSFAQTTYPKGSCMSLEELISKSPIIQHDVKLVKSVDAVSDYRLVYFNN
ncbi:MAG: hypothetical protein QNK65_04885 [Flavobacteriales bacterium]